jgi:ketosteroid isomerase-like protein
MNLAEMEKRLKTLEDIEAIRQMHNEYLFCLNNCQWGAMADYFTADASVSIHEKRRGRKEIMKLFTDVISKLNTGNFRDAHFAVQPVIQVDGEKAKSHWLIYVFVHDPATGLARKLVCGRYDCEYAREKDGWKFTSMIYTAPWPPPPGSR